MAKVSRRGRVRPAAPRPIKAVTATNSSNGNSAVSVVEAVVDAIRNDIKAGRLVPGQRLIEAEIRQEIPVGRASIREAMGRLEAEGLVEIEHQKGARVRRLTASDVEHLDAVREVLEGVAARLAAKNVKKRTYRKRLLALEREYAAENDGMPTTYLRYNEKFHRLIFEMSENPRLIRLVEQLQHSAFLILVQVIINRRIAERAYAEHKPILAAILKGDGPRAERAMRTHIRGTGRNVIDRIPTFRK